ncbi:MAG: hypothetical protein Q9227_001870 [Pyrenula ochraceoflavens]
MCEHWQFKCGHETKSLCRAYDQTANRQKPQEDPNAPMRVAFGTGAGWYSGSKGIGQSLPPPPPIYESDVNAPVRAVQVYTPQKAGVDTQLLTLEASQVCYGPPETPKIANCICYDCLLREGQERRHTGVDKFQLAAARAGVRIGEGQPRPGGGGGGLGGNLPQNALQTAQVQGGLDKQPGVLARHTLNDGGAPLKGAKHGRGLTLLGVGPPPKLTYTELK